MVIDMRSEYLNCLLLKELASLPSNQMARSKWLAKQLDYILSQKSVTVHLKWLRQRGYVNKILPKDWWMSDEYVAGYWVITEQGREFLLKMSIQ